MLFLFIPENHTNGEINNLPFEHVEINLSWRGQADKFTITNTFRISYMCGSPFFVNRAGIENKDNNLQQCLKARKIVFQKMRTINNINYIMQVETNSWINSNTIKEL